MGSSNNGGWPGKRGGLEGGGRCEGRDDVGARYGDTVVKGENERGVDKGEVGETEGGDLYK